MATDYPAGSSWSRLSFLCTSQCLLCVRFLSSPTSSVFKLSTVIKVCCACCPLWEQERHMLTIQLASVTFFVLGLSLSGKGWDGNELLEGWPICEMPVNAQMVVHTDGIYTWRLTEVPAQTQTWRHTHTQMHKHTDRHTDLYTQRHIYRETHSTQTCRQTHSHRHLYTYNHDSHTHYGCRYRHVWIHIQTCDRHRCTETCQWSPGRWLAACAPPKMDKTLNMNELLLRHLFMRMLFQDSQTCPLHVAMAHCSGLPTPTKPQFWQASVYPGVGGSCPPTPSWVSVSAERHRPYSQVLALFYWALLCNMVARLKDSVNWTSLAFVALF